MALQLTVMEQCIIRLLSDGDCPPDASGELTAPSVVAAAAVAGATATPPAGGRRRRPRRVAAHAPLPAVHGRVVVPAPPSSYLLSFEGVPPSRPPRASVGLGDQDRMGACIEQDSMNKHT